MSEFKIGDVVRLKSGGPLMTVHDIGDYGLEVGSNLGLYCIWFNNGNRVAEVFHPNTVYIEQDN